MPLRVLMVNRIMVCYCFKSSQQSEPWLINQCTKKNQVESLWPSAPVLHRKRNKALITKRGVWDHTSQHTSVCCLIPSHNILRKMRSRRKIPTLSSSTSDIFIRIVFAKHQPFAKYRESNSAPYNFHVNGSLLTKMQKGLPTHPSIWLISTSVGRMSGLCYLRKFEIFVFSGQGLDDMPRLLFIRNHFVFGKWWLIIYHGQIVLFLFYFYRFPTKNYKIILEINGYTLCNQIRHEFHSVAGLWNSNIFVVE